MKTKPLLKKIKAKTFLKDYLSALGVENVESYISGGEYCYDELKNCDTGVQKLHHAINNIEQKFFVLIDSDADGQLSASMMVDFLLKMGIHKDNIIYYQHTAKQHGLRETDEKTVDKIIESGANFCIIPDAGSNDIDECKYLKDNGVQVLILDHHPIEQDNPYATVINVFNGEYSNKSLSGTGVVHKFIKQYCDYFNYVTPEYRDIVAISIISDVCDLRSLENRIYVQEGLEILSKGEGNPFLYEMSKKLNKKGNVPIGLSFGIIPPINALCRGENYEDKYTFFEALSGLSDDIDNGIKVARRAHTIQRSTVEKIDKAVRPTLNLEHKGIVEFVDAEYKNYVGLVANRISSAYNKPTVLLREKINNNYYSGSVRSPIDIATTINQTGIALCQGHERACGIEIAKDKVDEFKEWLDNLSIDEPETIIAAEIKPENITLGLCRVCENNKMLWGSSISAGVCEPVFRVKCDFRLEQIVICGKNKDCVRLINDKVDFWKFKCDQDTLQMFNDYDCAGYTVDMLVKLGVNEWNDTVNPKAVIEEWEITPFELINWEDEF